MSPPSPRLRVSPISPAPPASLPSTLYSLPTTPMPPFLGRTEEQAQFRRVLDEYKTNWAQKNLPTFTNALTKWSGKAKTAPEKPYIFLFYGAGGMGKTTLTRRLASLIDTEYAHQFQHFLLDWEDKQKLNIALQVGHDHIESDKILDVLHDALTKAGWGKYFDDYGKQRKQLSDIEAKVDKALSGQPSDNAMLNEVAKRGAQGIAFIIRRSTGLEAASKDIESVLKISAEALSQTRQFVQRALETQEYDLYANPNERLAEALGKGLTKLTQQKPLVLLFDTYEIIDRPECDYTLRHVMGHSGGRVLWVVSGRSNLADSGQLGGGYFRGYKRDFPEDRVYAKQLSEFGIDEIQKHFAAVAPQQTELTDEQADAMSRFSLGIPFVVNQAAVMYRDGKPVEEIVEPVQRELGKTTARDAVIKATCERFLVHCFSAKDRAQDLQAIYALALMRRPNAELLREMLEVTDGLERRLQTLRERYSFILVDELRLDEKLANFLRDYLLNPMRRTERDVQTLNKRAIAWLEPQLKTWGQGIEDTAEKLTEERIAEGRLDLAHHYFWQSEDAGWQYLVPRFIEGWQYDRA
ncbi:MAG: hypothetical protein AAFV72_12585 [Cyanobacteria bacterium J06635_1]